MNRASKTGWSKDEWGEEAISEDIGGEVRKE